jgi:hypothetical protein
MDTSEPSRQGRQWLRTEQQTIRASHRRAHSTARGRVGYSEDERARASPNPKRSARGTGVRASVTRAEVLDIPTIRHVAIERGKPALVVWIDKHEQEYGQGLLNGFRAEN